MMKKRRMRNYSNNYSTTTAGHNGRMRAAELARDSVFALVPCKEMARGSGSLVLCAKKARESGAQRRSKHKYETCFGKNGRAGMIGSIYSLHFVVCCYY